jgi:hypothetical protein
MTAGGLVSPVRNRERTIAADVKLKQLPMPNMYARKEESELSCDELHHPYFELCCIVLPCNLVNCS